MVARFIVLIAYIDIFGIHNVLVFVLRVVIAESEVAEVAHCGRRHRVGRVSIYKVPRGVCLARKNVCNAHKAHVARGAESKAGVNAVLRVFYPLQIHRERAVDKHDYLAELARIIYHFYEVCLFFVEGKQGNAVGVGLIIEVNALAAEAGQKHYRRIVIIVCIRIFEVGGIKILPHFAYIRLPGSSGRYPVHVAVQIGVVHSHIYIEAGRFEGV